MLREILKLLSRDNLQVQALSECYEMIDMCDEMLRAAVVSLRQRDDASMDIDIFKMDKTLNSFERDVRRKVMTHLSLGNTADLASGMTLVSIVIDLERIGDYTKNIYDLAVNHPTRLNGGEFEEGLAEIEKTALENFDRTTRSFKSGDIEEARSLMTDYKEDISSKVRGIESKLVAGETETTMATSDAVSLALYLRFLKRISAHSRNLISSLVNPVDRIGYDE